MPMIVLSASSMKKPSHMVNQLCAVQAVADAVKRGCAQTEMKEKYANVTIYYPCLTRYRLAGAGGGVVL
jgi:hypothetical protein